MKKNNNNNIRLNQADSFGCGLGAALTVLLLLLLFFFLKALHNLSFIRAAFQNKMTLKIGGHNRKSICLFILPFIQL